VKSEASKGTKEINAISGYYQCTLREARDYAKILSTEDKKYLVDLMEDAQ
jgi:hypothetical protein